MAEGRTGDIFWGALGDAIYSLDQHTWLFSRRPRQLSINAKPLLPEQEVAQYNDEASAQQGQPLKDPQKGVRKLVRSFPELHGAADILIEELNEQHLHFPLDAAEEILRGDMLAIELLYMPKYHSHIGSIERRPYLLIANPGGSLGQKLSVTMVPKTQDVRESGPADYFSINNRKRLWWQNSSMEPISQVCSAGSFEDGSVLIGVRRASSVDIIAVEPWPHQDIRKQGIPAAPKGQTGDLQTIAHWASDVDGDACYMDFTFNPWDPSYVALVDNTGAWCSYILGSSSEHEQYTLISKGMTRSPQDDRRSSDRGNEKLQWRKVLWICNATMLLVCSRTMLEVFDAETGQSLICEVFEASTNERNMLIADAKRNPNAADELFLLTTVHIIWLRVRVDEDDITQLDWLYQLPHGRDQDDITLSISFILDIEDESYETSIEMSPTLNPAPRGTSLVLYSADIPLLEMYHFDYQNNLTSPIQTVSDPRAIPYPLKPSGCDYSGTRTFRRTFNAHIQPLQKFFQDSSTPDYSFYQIFVLNDGYELATQIYSVGQVEDLSQNTKPEVPAAVVDPLPSPEALYTQSRAENVPVATNLFIVDESDQSSEEKEETARSLSILRNPDQVSAISAQIGAPFNSTSWGMSVEELYQAILAFSRNREGLDLPLWVEQQLLALSPVPELERSQKGQGQPSILKLRIPDLEKAAHILESVISRLSSHPRRLNLQMLPGTQRFGLQRRVDNSRTLAELYRDIKELWGASGPVPLERHISRSRHKLMLDLAIELYLSNITIVPPESAASPRDLIANLDAEQVMDKTVERLRSLTVLTEAAPSLNNAAANVLAHWDVGKDPALYDHGATSARISNSQAETADRAGSSKRGKLARALHEHRMKQEHRHKDDLRMTASQPYALHTAQESPMIPQPGFDNSSQQTGPSSAQQDEGGQQAIIGSQPMPGAYGSRKTGLAFRAAKGKGPRKAGF